VAAIACVAVAVGVLAFYLSVYAVRGYDQPLGYDTARYLWRTTCVAAGGLAELRRCAPVQAAIPSRVGYPLVSLLLSALLPVSRYQLAAILPPVAAAAIALAGAALVAWSMRLDTPRFVAVAVVVGVSPIVVAMADPEGYADTMLALAVALAGLLAVASVAEGGKGYGTAAALVALAAMVHLSTGVVIAAVLAGVAIVYLPELWARRRSGRGVAGAVPVRLGIVLVGAVGLWTATMLAAVRSRPDAYRTSVADLKEKFRSHWPRLGLPVAVPAAAAGAAALTNSRSWTDSNRWRQSFLVRLLLVWLAIVALAVVAWFAGWKLPVHRFLLLSIPLPMLGGVALLWLADRASTTRPSLGPAVVIGGCLAVAVAGYVLWTHSSPPMLRSPRLDAAGIASTYIAELPRHQTVTVITSQPSINPDALAQTFRVAVDEDRLADIRFSNRLPVMSEDDDRVVLLLDGYAIEFASESDAHPDRLVAERVLVLSGPVSTSTPYASTGPGQRLGAGLPALLAGGALTVLLLGVVGAGWMRWTLPNARPLEWLGSAPAAGVAVLVVDGLVLDLVGARIGMPGALVAVAASAALGAILALRRV
jgi:hypothetical protein